MNLKKGICMGVVLSVASFLCTGCETDAESSEVQTSVVETATETTVLTEEATTAETEASEETLQVIGEEMDGEAVYVIELTNAAKQDIVGIQVTYADTDETTENLLDETDVFAVDETRIWYYDASREMAQDGSFENTSVVLTFADETTAELHELPFEEMESAVVQMEEDVAYLVYTSVETGEEESTLEAELNWIAAAEESAAAVAAEESAAAQAEAEASAAAAAEESAAAQAAAEASAAAAAESQAAVEESTAQQEVEESVVVEESSTADADDGCIGDGGLFY